MHWGGTIVVLVISIAFLVPPDDSTVGYIFEACRPIIHEQGNCWRGRLSKTSGQSAHTGLSKLAAGSAEVFDEHRFGLFLTRLIECDGASVGGCAEPERRTLEYSDCRGAMARGIVEAENRLMP